MARGKLSIYDSKRDFARTTEPSGSTPAVHSHRLRYVIQKHAATRLHWDLRLEVDGVFKSWAVTRGPSLDPADKRLAVEVEDHPLSYGDFEGTIPKGEYGGGSVQLWDRGYWQPDLEEDPAASLKRGELKFSLDGKRLHGSWVLVRMRSDRNGGKRVNWLLIKHRESEAKGKGRGATPAKATQAMMADDRSVASGRSMQQIAAGKGKTPVPFMNAKPAVAADAKHAATADPQPRRAKSGNIPAFVEPQLCKLVDSPPASDDWIHEIKLDGYRLQLRVVDGKATLKTRKGLDWTEKFQAVAEVAAKLPDCLIDGELCVLDNEGRSSFAALQAALVDDDMSAHVFFAFDLLFDPTGDLRKLPLLERKLRLRALLKSQKKSSPLRYVDHMAGTGREMWEHACQLNLEGVVSKRAQSAYTSGRTPVWVKSKCRAGQEVIIGGYTSAGKELRSLLVGVMRGDKLHYAGRVGTGYGGDVSRIMLPKLRALAADSKPFLGDAGSRGGIAVHWVKPKLVAEIEFAGWTGDHMVRQAAFKGLRGDKPAEEVHQEIRGEVAMQKPRRVAGEKRERRSPAKATIGGARAASDAGDATVSHPDKVLWPATPGSAQGTKQDLADYLQSIAEWMLPHTRGRPCSLVRAPDGIASQQFFQRHAMAGHSADVHTIRLAGDRQPYLLVDSAEALHAIAQMAGIELHPGNGVPDRPEVPGRLVFDLDPGPDVDFKRVIEGALELRERLKALGLESFCKTTGGKGLHVVTPLAPERGRGKVLTWATAKLFAQTLCAQVSEDAPKKYLINMSKAARKGKIFLDYLRNDRLATAVAPLSPRARPGATVSMPLQWSQVKAGLAPAKFTIHTAASLLVKTKPWTDYERAASPLAAAAAKLLDSGSANAA